ncbi:MAG: phosphoribosyltransferase [Acidobacteriaceae bacterium]
MRFMDRREAGRALARGLRKMPGLNGALVLALPRGGVPVGYEVARGLGLPLDVLVVRKLGVPGQEELAMGAVSGSGVLVVNPDVVRALGIGQEEIEARAAHERAEIARREALYRGGRRALDVAGRTALVVDDGLATGSTMMAAVRSLRPVAGRVVVAVPVGSRGACEDLRRVADEVICLQTPEPFHAVGEFYEDFWQTSDAEVAELLAEANRQG